MSLNRSSSQERDEGLTGAREWAAEWLARRDAGWSPNEQAEFDAWREASPVHRQAAEELELTYSLLSRPQTRFSATVLDTLATRRRRRVRRQLTAGAVSGLILVAAFLGWRTNELSMKIEAPLVADTRMVQRPLQQVLEDGSVVELNSHAVLEVDFSAQTRRVILRRGIAHFAVAKDSSRPFLVQVGETTVRAVGTEFSVEVAPKSVEVIVAEGKVDVAASSAVTDVQPVRLEAGVRASVPSDGVGARQPEVSAVSPDQLARALAWRRQRVELNEMPLADAVVLFNRLNDVKLEVADRAVGAVRVSGICWVDNPRAFARMVEATFGVRVEERSSGGIVFRSDGPVD